MSSENWVFVPLLGGTLLKKYLSLCVYVLFSLDDCSQYCSYVDSLFQLISNSVRVCIFNLRVQCAEMWVKCFIWIIQWDKASKLRKGKVWVQYEGNCH